MNVQHPPAMHHKRYQDILPRPKALRAGRTLNTRLPCIANDGGMIIVTRETQGHSTKTTQRHCGQVERRIMMSLAQRRRLRRVSLRQFINWQNSLFIIRCWM
ncbi:MAG: hypothetical protein U9R02_04190, partial [Thermodesulfobacteriota bacterium]|nr:hypothetical protein [Thermodesulfobacteriota bacterium]